MRHYVDWAVKNRANVILHDDTFLDPSLKTVSEEIWEYMDRRGLKTILEVNPGNEYGGHSGVTEED